MTRRAGILQRLDTIFMDLRSIVRQLHAMPLDYFSQDEKNFIAILENVLADENTTSYDDTLLQLDEDTLNNFYNTVQYFFTEFSNRIAMQTKTLNEQSLPSTVTTNDLNIDVTSPVTETLLHNGASSNPFNSAVQKEEHIDLGTWNYLGGGKYHAKEGATLSGLEELLLNQWSYTEYDENRLPTKNYDRIQVGDVIETGVYLASKLNIILNSDGSTYVVDKDIAVDQNEERSYVERSLNQILKGNYTDDVTLVGTSGQIILGVFGVDLPMDIRDTVYNITNWEWTWKHAGKTLLDGIGLIPIIGVVKNIDEAVALAKGTKVRGGVKHTGSVADVSKKFDINTKPNVSNKKLQNIINDLYKGQNGKNTIGNGTTMDAVRNEIITGQPTNGRFHTQKMKDYVNALKRRLRSGDLRKEDKSIAEALLEDAVNALKGK